MSKRNFGQSGLDAIAASIHDSKVNLSKHGSSKSRGMHKTLQERNPGVELRDLADQKANAGPEVVQEHETVLTRIEKRARMYEIPTSIVIVDREQRVRGVQALLAYQKMHPIE